MAVRRTLRKMMRTAMMSQQQPAGRQGRRASSSSSSNDAANRKIPLCWLDLRGSGLSVLERLCLEECILQKEAHGGFTRTTSSSAPPPRHWVIAGHHEAVRHRYLKERDVAVWNIKENESSSSSSAGTWMRRVATNRRRSSWELGASRSNCWSWSGYGETAC